MEIVVFPRAGSAFEQVETMWNQSAVEDIIQAGNAGLAARIGGGRHGREGSGWVQGTGSAREPTSLAGKCDRFLASVGTQKPAIWR